MILKYNDVFIYDEIATYNGFIELTYNSPVIYDFDTFYNNTEEVFQEIVATNFQPTFTGPPRDSGGITTAAFILGHRKNKEEEELLSLLGYL
jgi:hypothetical protein